jgi:lipopolysaccharide biosynthesis glycosyltransferase
MLPGLHGTVFSLVKNLSRREEVALALFLQDVNDAESQALRRTVQQAGGVGQLLLRDADVSSFKGLKSFHGDWMAYMRLFLPNLLPEAETIVYLDSDLIVNTDVRAFFDLPLKDQPLAAVVGEPVQWSLDHKFLKSVGLANEDRCFNSGVLILNARAWRRQGLVERCLDFARTHDAAQKGHDQTILNAIFSRNFYGLARQFNLGVSTADRLKLDDGIYHFIGSPKPWDPLGRFVHRSWRAWNKVIEQTSFNWNDYLKRHRPSYLRRAWNLRRSYLASLFKW